MSSPSRSRSGSGARAEETPSGTRRSRRRLPSERRSGQAAQRPLYRDADSEQGTVTAGKGVQLEADWESSRKPSRDAEPRRTETWRDEEVLRQDLALVVLRAVQRDSLAEGLLGSPRHNTRREDRHRRERDRGDTVRAEDVRVPRSRLVED